MLLFNFFFIIIFNKNLFNLLLNMSIIISLTFLSLSITDLFIIWFIMEINNFLFMSLMIMNSNNKKPIFFYFIIQMISSSLLILSFIISLSNSNYLINIILMLSVMLKLNIPPLHFWMVILINYLNWFMIILLLSIQKIIPFYIISFNLINPILFILLIMLSSIIPPFISINILNFKKIFLYSSINQTSWFIFLIFLKNFIWLLYFISYSLISIIIMKFINQFKLNFFFKFYNYFYLSITNLFIILNMASLPPFMFMLLKWFNMYFFINSMNMNLMLFILMFNSLVMTFIYMNLMNISFFKNSFNLKFIYPNLNLSFYYSSMMILFLSLSTFFIMI